MFFAGARAIDIKDLKDLRTVFYRSAGACPPRSLDCASDGEGQALALRNRVAFFRSAGPSEVSIRASERVSSEIAAWRGTGPRPTVNGAVPATVARGPVPRERWMT